MTFFKISETNQAINYRNTSFYYSNIKTKQLITEILHSIIVTEQQNNYLTNCELRNVHCILSVGMRQRSISFPLRR